MTCAGKVVGTETVRMEWEFRWPFACVPEGDASPLQVVEESFSNREFVRSPHGECVDAGLRRGRRRPCSAPAASASPSYYGERHPDKCVRIAREHAEFFRDG
jgi:hypothetical protein